MVQPVDLGGCTATGEVGHGAPGHEPHHELDPLRPGLAHVLHVLDRGLALGVVDDPLQELAVPRLVDQAGAGPLELVAHAAGAPDLHVEVLVVALDGTAQRPAQLQAAAPGRDGVLHDVDNQRDDRARPRVGLPEHDRQRHGAAVVDTHVVDEGQVEVLADDRVRDVRRQRRMPDHRRHRPGAPALVGRLVLWRHAEREGRHHLEAEGVGVIIEDQHHGIGRVGRHPFACGLIAGEQRRVVGLGGLVEVHGHADGGHVAGVDACGDLSHGQRWPSHSCR